MKYTAVLFSVFLSFLGFGQNPFRHWTDAFDTHFSNNQPVINYILTVDTTNLSFYTVEMRLQNVPATFKVAMVTHPEYDDRFWRFVEDMRVITKAGNGNILREDSAVWKVQIEGSEALIQYKIHLPKPQEGQRPSWTPFLSSSGGLLGGPHSFMYVVGATLAPSYVTIVVPHNWQIATGLQPTSDPAVFFAPSVALLVDCPVLAGKLAQWSFPVDGVPHRIVYWLLPDSKPIDATRLVSSVQKLVQQVCSFFGRLPYREYTFLFQDNAYGSLEHSNSVTVGIPASQVEKYFTDHIGEIAHEYFHSWNLVRIRPVEYGDVSYTKQPLSKGLWFSEGFTMLYADLLSRRAGLPVEDSTRIQHLERLIRRYYNSPGNRKISPEKVSMAEYGPQEMLGNYIGSAHLQGELLGTALDFIIRNATNGKKTLDNVMQMMMERFSGEKGFAGRDIEQIVKEVCGCEVHSFFENYVRGNKSLDLDQFLRLAGLKFSLSWTPALNPAKEPNADWRLYAWTQPGEPGTRAWVTNPESCWAKAGLTTGDIILTVNEKPVTSTQDLEQVVRNAKIGDRITMKIQRHSIQSLVNVTVTGYQVAVVQIQELSARTDKQKQLLQSWVIGR
jgi:predicted metalloprotease with PDZ domain